MSRPYVRDWKGRFSKTSSHKVKPSAKALKKNIVVKREQARKDITARRNGRHIREIPTHELHAEIARRTPFVSTHTAAASPVGGPGVAPHKFSIETKIGRNPDGTMNFDVRSQYVDAKLNEFRYGTADKPPLSSESLYRDKNGEWTPERKRKQHELLEHIWQQRAAHVPNEGKALFAGGLGGAGKGTTLRERIKVDNDQYFTVNPDDIKEMMAQPEWDMIPKADPNLTPMELSPLVHEECSTMADMLAQRAYREKKNIVWDFTMSSEKSVTVKRLEPMRKAGYSQINAVFVDVSVDRSVGRAQKRWRGGLQSYLDGKNKVGGRFLPSAATAENLPPEGSPYRSKNRVTFEAVKHKFDGYVVFDNDAMDEQGKSISRVEEAKGMKV